MKCKFLSGCLALAVPVLAHAAADFYVNDGVIICPPMIPPQVDATNFVNNNFFSINFTNFTENSQKYKTANTLNFTNNGQIIGNTGFQFDTGPSGAGQRRMAANFNNPGLISVGSVANTNLFFNFFFFFAQNTFLPKLFISATNVVNSGTNLLGLDGLFNLQGKTVDLNRGAISMESFENVANQVTTLGIFDGYWGVGTNIMNPFNRFQIPPPDTPAHLVATAGGLAFFQILSLPAATAYVDVNIFGTNRFVEVAFVSNTNSAIGNNVYFPFIGEIIVEWVGLRTNPITGATSTNYVYLLDDFGTFATNMLVPNNTTMQTPFPTFIPRNYTFLRGGPLFFGTPAPSGLPVNTFNSSAVTNDFAAYQAIFQPVTQVPGNIPGATVTNLPGRIEITADGVLNLSRTRITGPNYLNLKATNHFAGSSFAQIEVPLNDIFLAATNGQLVITNLVAPKIPRISGDVELWSGRWTNAANGFLNQYHVLFVDSHLSPTAPAVVQDLNLRSTNVVIHDILNVTRNFMIEAERLTVAANQEPAPTPTGEINLLSSQIIWPTSTPRLQYLTNNGIIRVLNATFFGGSRTTPFFTSNFNEPYISFVNHGTVTNDGSLIWARYFENNGGTNSGAVFNSGAALGSIVLESQTALLTNGFFVAPGDVSITSAVLTNISHVLSAGRKLTLDVTDVLTDTVTNTTTITVVSNAIPITLTIVSNANSWAAGNGVDLPVKPRLGDLLGTTILDTAPAGAEVRHLWAAEDRGCSPAGFTDNVALGRLILDGGNDCLFRFTAAPLGLTFDDAASQLVPPSGAPVRSGTYHPANYVPARQMLTNGVPASIASLLSLPYPNSLADFRGTSSLNGDWRLFIDDRTTTHLGNSINWAWKLGVAVLASNYTQTTTAVFINGFPVSTTSTVSTNYVGTHPAFAGSSIVLSAGSPSSGGAVAQPYPSANSVSLPLRNDQIVTSFFGTTNQVGPNVFVTNTTQRVYTTDHVTNVVVSLSAPTVSFPADLDVLLVGPHGEKAMLMAGAGALDTANRNGLYVDYLELRNFTTNFDFNGNIAGVQIDPNMTVYFAQAIISGVPQSQADRINGRNGGGFCWVSNYAGIYSSTNLFYGGATNTLNAALVQHQSLDSDCDGLVNVDDPEPIFLVTTAGLPEATNNTAYSAQLQAGGGLPPYTWALAPGSAPLPDGLHLSSDGLISGTPTQTGFFTFMVRASVATPCGLLTADRRLSVNVSPGILALSVALVSQPSQGALVSWPGIPNSTNYVYFKPSPQASDWLLLTNFGVGGAVPSRVSVFDPLAGNATRFYRVQVSTQH